MSSETPEVIEVRYSRNMLSVHNVFTNNIIIEPENISSLHRTVADIIAPSIGIAFNGQGGVLQSYNIRGLSRARIKTLVNGVPVVTDRRAGNSLSFIPADFVNQVTILKGPSSSLYGSNALGGVVSVSTYNDVQSWLMTRYQPGNGSASVSGSYTGEFYSLAASHRKEYNADSASESGISTELNTQFEQSYLSANSQFEWHELTIDVSTIYSRGADIGKSSNTFPEEKISFYPKDNHWLNQIAFSYQNLWRANFYHHNQAWQTDTTRLNAENKNIERRNRTDYTSDTIGGYGAYLIGDTQIGAEWLSRANINIHEQEYSAQDQIKWQQKLVDATESNGAIFAQQRWHKNKLNVTAGLRYDWYGAENSNPMAGQSGYKVNEHFLSYSLNGLYELSPSTQVSIEFANSFRFPTVSELFFSGDTPRGNIQGNNNLKPEHSAGSEVGIKHQVNDELSFAFNGYHYAIDKYIERYSVNEVLESYRNNQQVTIKGVELLANWQLLETIFGSLGYQYQSAEDDDGNTVDDRLPEAVKLSVNGWLDVGLANQLHVTNQLEYQLSNSSYGPNEFAQDARLTWHSRLKYDLNHKHTLSVNITNLTNQLYRVSADEQAPFQQERTISLTWQWFFD